MPAVAGVAPVLVVVDQALLAAGGPSVCGAVAVERHPDARTRIEKGATIVLLRTITPDPEYVGCFDVESESAPGTFYSVDHGVGVCQCPDQQRRGGTCGHLWALELLRALARLQADAGALAEAA